MPVTEDDLMNWLGPWDLRVEKVQSHEWGSPEWRAQYLCQKVNHRLYHVHDEPDGAWVEVVFAEKRIG